MAKIDYLVTRLDQVSNTVFEIKKKLEDIETDAYMRRFKRSGEKAVNKSIEKEKESLDEYLQQFMAIRDITIYETEFIREGGIIKKGGYYYLNMKSFIDFLKQKAIRDDVTQAEMSRMLRSAGYKRKTKAMNQTTRSVYDITALVTRPFKAG